MKLTLNPSPVRQDRPTAVSVFSTVLAVDGVDYDLIKLPDGATAEHPILGTVSRDGDSYECAVILGHGQNAPHETRFPEPIVLENHYGPVELPPYDAPPAEEPAE